MVHDNIIEVCEEIAEKRWRETQPASDLPKSIDVPKRKTVQLMSAEPQKSDWPVPVQVAMVLLILFLLGLYIVFGR